jgi:hypothetical protein
LNIHNCGQEGGEELGGPHVAVNRKTAAEEVCRRERFRTGIAVGTAGDLTQHEITTPGIGQDNRGAELGL